MDVDSLAQQLVSSGPEQLIQVLGRVDEILTEQAGVSLADVIEASGLDEGDAEEEAPVMYQEEANTFSTEAPVEAMPSGGRQRITLR